MAPLFEDIDPIEAGESFMMRVMEQLVRSEELASEPELRQVFFPPSTCAHAFWEILDILDPEYDPSQGDQIPEEAGQRAIEQIAGLFYSHPARDGIMASLDALRQRLRREGCRDAAAKAAGLQYFLGTDVGEEIWPLVGLIQALVRRSVEAGIRLSRVTASLADGIGSDEDTSSDSGETQRASLEESLASLREIPGMESFMSKEVDRAWIEGLSEMARGEIFLGLYTPPEIIGALDILHAQHKASAQQGETLDAIQERGHDFTDEMARYVAELLSPKRLEQMRSRLREVRREAASDPPMVAFIDGLLERLSAKDPAQGQRLWLALALLGEASAAVAAYREMKAAEGEEPSGAERTAGALEDPGGGAA
ncbi:MAG: hypothetical protein JXA74_08580 [Anaerolineae bacterium]|nr:hypothetical protein [Anaerolineae bacterium]